MNSNLLTKLGLSTNYITISNLIDSNNLLTGKKAIDLFKKGNKIRIKKKNKGKFTEYCGGKVTQECIKRGKSSSDPKIRKRATFAANARKWKHLLGGVINLEDKDILWKLNDIFGANSSKDRYFSYWDFQKGDSEVNNYFNSYINSKGINRILNNLDTWWKSRHPYRKWYSNSDQGTKEWLRVAKEVNPLFYTADMYSDLSAVYTIPKVPNSVIIMGRRNNQEFPYNFTVGHEYAHGKTPFSLFGNAIFHNRSAQKEALDLNTNTEPGHDSLLDEKHADNWGLKYLLYKEGIYDARSEKDITVDQIEELRLRYPELRPFKLMTNELILFLLNNVAFNKSDKLNNLIT